MFNSLPPALTPNQWTRRCAEYPLARRSGYAFTIEVDKHGLSVGNEFDMEGCLVLPEAYHALAALCLYEQPFGFSREELRAVRHVSEEGLGYDHRFALDPELAPLVASVANKIAALLPPE